MALREALERSIKRKLSEALPFGERERHNQLRSTIGDTITGKLHLGPSLESDAKEIALRLSRDFGDEGRRKIQKLLEDLAEEHPDPDASAELKALAESVHASLSSNASPPASASNARGPQAPGAKSPPASGQLDFFISYTGQDRAWAGWIASTLEDAGYTTKHQGWDFGPGSNFLLEMDKAMSEAERTVLVLSKASLESEYVRLEWGDAIRQDPTGKKRKLVPIRIDPVEPRGVLGSIVYIDFVGADEASAREKLLGGVSGGRNKPGQAPPFPGR